MEKKTQLEFVVKRLQENGQVSRNDCLRHYITRLTSRIWDLKQVGWEFEIERKEGDYIYKVITNPLNKGLTEDEMFDLYEPIKNKVKL